MRIWGWKRILTRYSIDFVFVLQNCNICLKIFLHNLSTFYNFWHKSLSQTLQGRPCLISLVPYFSLTLVSLSLFSWRMALAQMKMKIPMPMVKGPSIFILSEWRCCSRNRARAPPVCLEGVPTCRTHGAYEPFNIRSLGETVQRSWLLPCTLWRVLEFASVAAILEPLPSPLVDVLAPPTVAVLDPPPVCDLAEGMVSLCGQ